MKSKYFTYLLFALVLLIWGLIIYNINKNFKSNETTILKKKKSVIISNDKNNEDTFSLVLDYDDPFQKVTQIHENRDKINNGNKISIKPIKNRDVVSDKPFTTDKMNVLKPDIHFYGIIKNKTTGNNVAIINFKNKEYFVSVGDTISKLTVKKIGKDTLVLNNNVVDFMFFSLKK